MKRRNATLDLAKFIASWMIVAIHTALFADVNETLYFCVVHIVCRLAVPFFAICSGYFIGTKYRFEGGSEAAEGNLALFFRQWKELFVMYVFWSVVYLLVSIPRWIETGWFSAWAFVDYAVAACTMGSYYHLWYLWGMVYVLPICYAVLRWIPRKFWTGMIILLWICEVYGYAYSHILSSLPDLMSAVLNSMGVLLRLLPLLLTGVIISQQPLHRIGWCFARFAVSLALLFLEAFTLRSLERGAVSYIFFTLPAAYFLFCCLLGIRISIPEKISACLADMSMVIYCVHPILIHIAERFIPNSIIQFLLCAAGASLLGWLVAVRRTKTVVKEG